MDQADAAVGRPDGPLRNFIMDVGSANHGLRQVLWKIGFVEAVGVCSTAPETILLLRLSACVARGGSASGTRRLGSTRCGGSSVRVGDATWPSARATGCAMPMGS
jgi:hypothetical protein